ncbi:MAG: YitT family protein [Clostridia bacterium]|nr:YitT family protein [Clostridia bacterium]
MYSKKSKKILFCISQNKEIPTIKNIVRDIDPKAFMFVTNSSEVLGEGFIENEENEVL